MSEPSSRPAGAYAFVEGRHLRQWALRAVAPLAAVATNGAGLLDVAWLPRHDAPGFPPDVEIALRIAGGSLVALAAVLRVAAKGVLVRRTEVTSGGVYAVVRHPFYLANLAGACGVFLLAGSLGAVVAVAWLALSVPLFAVTIAGEEAGLARVHGAAFTDYAARVPALFPTRLRRDRSGARVTWTNLRAEREPPRLLRFLAGATLVLGLTLPEPASIAVLAAAAVAFGVSYVLR